MRHLARGLILALLLSLLPLPAARIAAQSAPDTPIRSVAWSPANDRIAVGYDDGTVQIVDAATGQPIHTLRGHTGRVASLAWKPDGSELISGDFVINSYGLVTAMIWDTDTGQCLATLSGISPASVLGVSWSLDSSQIITFGFDVNPNLKFWDAVTYQLVSEVDKGGDAFQIVWSPDTTLVALANVAAQVVIANPATFDPVIILDEGQTSSGARGGVYTAAWSPDGSLVAGGNTAGTVRIWRVADGQNLLNMAGATSQELGWDTTTIHAVRFSADGTQLTAVAADGTFRTWDVSTGALLGSEQLLDAPIQAAAWNSDGTQLAYGGDSGVLHISEAPAPTVVEPSPIVDVAWSPDGAYIARTFASGTVEVVDAASQALVFRSTSASALGRAALAWNPAQAHQLAAGIERYIYGWDVVTGETLFTLLAGNPSGIATTEVGHYAECIYSLSWTPDGSRLASLSEDGILRVWQMPSGAMMLDTKTTQTYSLDWSPEGTQLLAGQGLGIARIDAATGAPDRFHPEGRITNGVIPYVDLSPDGTTLAGSTIAGDVYIWDAATGELDYQYRSPGDVRNHRNVRWSPDGSRLASVAWDGTLRIWDRAGNELGVRQETGRLNSVDWSPDGTQLAYGGDSGVLHISEAPAASGAAVSAAEG